MDLTEFLPLFSGVRKLFQPDTLNPDTSQGVLNPSIGQSADPGTQPQGGLDDNVAQITKLLLDRLNQPDPNVQRMTDLFNQFPAHQNPSIWRRLAAGGAAIGGGQDAAQAVLNAPDKHRQEDWILKSKQAKDITEADTKNQREEFGNAIKGINTEVVSGRNKDLADKAQRDSEFKLNKLAQDLDLTKQKLELEQKKNEIYGKSVEGQLREKDLALQAAQLQHQYENMLKDNTLAETIRNHNLENAAKDAAGWSQPFKVKDPNDPTQEIQMSFNLRTGQSRKLTADDQVITGDISKPLSGSAAANSSSGGQLTQQTKAMMEGSKMLYPHIAELRKQAADLDKRGLFGPVMSRVRDIAAKVGTTGDPGKVAQDFQNLATSITSDRNMPNDAAVGQFLTTLGLVASGAGRVHGGARGGGSIQMVNYMKSLLSSDSTLSMFNGRLNGLDSFIKGYAAGPAQPSKPTGLDKAIEDVLKGIK